LCTGWRADKASENIKSWELLACRAIVLANARAFRRRPLIKKLNGLTDQVNALFIGFERLSDAELRERPTGSSSAGP